MKSNMLALGGLVALLATGAAVGVAQKVGAPGAPQTPPTGRHGRHEKHPELMNAMRALERAKCDLHNAARDFGGHRAKAEELAEQAIKVVQ